MLAIGACEGEARSIMSFVVDSHSFGPQGHGGLRIDLKTNNGHITLTSDSFSEESGLARSDAVEVPNSGEAVLGIEFSEGGQTIAEGDLSIELRDATRWGVRFFRAAEDPSEDCIGCEGISRFAIASDKQREPDDAIWVLWGGLREGEVAVTKTLDDPYLPAFSLTSWNCATAAM
jgi:hypothetical protein